VAELLQSLQERLDGRANGIRADHLPGCSREADDADARDLAPGLGGGGTGHPDSAEGDAAADERAPLHHVQVTFARASKTRHSKKSRNSRSMRSRFRDSLFKVATNR